MHKQLFSHRTVAMKMAYALVALAGSMSSGATAQSSGEKVDFRLDWSLSGYHLPFYWASKKGYYKDEGLNVEVKPGSGSQQAINLVAGNHDDVGFVNRRSGAQSSQPAP